MCLESRAWWFRAAKVGFKVLEYDTEKETLVSFHYPSEALPMNEWLKEEDFRTPTHQQTEWESGIFMRRGVYYPYGFHSFHKIEDALLWKLSLEQGSSYLRYHGGNYELRIVVVMIEEPVAKGKQCLYYNSTTDKEHRGRVTVSKRIKIVKIL